MKKGTIARIISDKGYGFIREDNAAQGSKDMFFHARDMEEGMFDRLKEGMTVTYNVAESDKGPKAVDVQPA